MIHIPHARHAHICCELLWSLAARVYTHTRSYLLALELVAGEPTYGHWG